MPISQYILNSSEQQRLNLRLRNKWMIRIRWYYVTLLALVAVGSTLIAIPGSPAIRHYLIFTAIALAANGLLWLAATFAVWQTMLYYRVVAFGQVLLDIIMASWIVYAQGGLTSRTTVLYAIPILITGVLFRAWFAYVTAFLSALSYALSLLAVYYFLGRPANLVDLFVPVVFYSSVFFILAAIVSRITAMNAVNEREKSYNELLALLRHQLHHPIGVISAIIEMLENGKSYSQFSVTDRRFLKQLKQENRRMHSMISNLLEAGEQSIADKTTQVNLVAIVEDAAVNCATAARRLEDLDARYFGQALIIQGRQDQLTLAFENIIDNAFRYSKPGSKVTIGVHESKPVVEVSVLDHGAGMNPSKQRRLFARFSSFEHDNSEEDPSDMYNLGLGLYVSKLIIERHGGEIDVKSEPGKGTKVIIKLKEGPKDE